MADILSRFPVATHKIYDREDEEENKRILAEAMPSIGSGTQAAPPYGHRRGWVPRCAADFGDGGAFPEIIAAQYPLAMGHKKETSNALAKQLDAAGNVKYDAIARQGHTRDKVVHSKYQDLVPTPMADNDDDLDRPSDEKLKEISDSTKNALNALVEKQISAAMPVQAAEKLAPAQYIRYTPANQGAAFNSGAKQRIIRMVEMQKDPMEPPKFKVNKKIPRGPPSPPAPVLHSPNRKVTVKEQQDWKIPPCISNWKNAKGFTIPLEKRLAADGRGLQTVHINENFAKLAESLYIADRKAREAVEMRAQIEKKMAQKEKDKKEEALRQLAQRARDESSGISRNRAVVHDDDDVRERDDLRRDRAKERQRERNIARAAPDKRTRLQRDRERDISEKIALGMPSTAGSGGVQYDQRLFNQSKQVIEEMMGDLFYYHQRFYCILKCLCIFVRQLPGYPMGKQLRETYAICLENGVQDLDVYSKSVKLIRNFSRVEVQRMLGECVIVLTSRDSGTDEDEELTEIANSLRGFDDNYSNLDEKEKNEPITPREKHVEELAVVPKRTKMHELRATLLQMADNKSKRLMTHHELLRSRCVDYLDGVFRKYLIPPNSMPLYEAVYYCDASHNGQNASGQLRRSLDACIRANVQRALADPYCYIKSEDLHFDAGVINNKLPDLCIAYKLHLECGKFINLYDWLQAFNMILERDNTANKTSTAQLQARFIRCVSELQFLGFIKPTKKKTDHVARLTWAT